MGVECGREHADQMTTTGVGNGIEDESVSMAVEPEWRHLLYGHAMQLRDVNYYSDLLISMHRAVLKGH